MTFPLTVEQRIFTLSAPLATTLPLTTDVALTALPHPSGSGLPRASIPPCLTKTFPLMVTEGDPGYSEKNTAPFPVMVSCPLTVTGATTVHSPVTRRLPYVPANVPPAHVVPVGAAWAGSTPTSTMLAPATETASSRVTLLRRNRFNFMTIS